MLVVCPLQMTVKGLVRLEKLAPFFEELRTASRHRTSSLALLRPPPGASPSATDLIMKARAARADAAAGRARLLLLQRESPTAVAQPDATRQLCAGLSA